MKFALLLISSTPLLAALFKAAFSGRWVILLAGLVMAWLTYQMLFDRDIGVNFEYAGGKNKIRRWSRYLIFLFFFLYAMVKT